MQKYIKFIGVILLAGLLVGCSDKNSEKNIQEKQEAPIIVQENEENAENVEELKTSINQATVVENMQIDTTYCRATVCDDSCYYGDLPENATNDYFYDNADAIKGLLTIAYIEDDLYKDLKLRLIADCCNYSLMKADASTELQALYENGKQSDGTVVIAYDTSVIKIKTKNINNKDCEFIYVTEQDIDEEYLRYVLIGENIQITNDIQDRQWYLENDMNKVLEEMINTIEYKNYIYHSNLPMTE